MTLRRTLVAGVAALSLVGCGGTGDTAAVQTGGPPTAGSGVDQPQFPDVADVAVTREGDATFTFEVTMTSPYDTTERYADGWRILGPDDEVLGEMTLDHDHASEQPFTRSQTGVQVPAGVTEVVVEGRDILSGYGGATRSVTLPTS